MANQTLTWDDIDVLAPVGGDTPVRRLLRMSEQDARPGTPLFLTDRVIGYAIPTPGGKEVVIGFHEQLEVDQLAGVLEQVAGLLRDAHAEAEAEGERGTA